MLFDYDNGMCFEFKCRQGHLWCFKMYEIIEDEMHLIDDDRRLTTNEVMHLDGGKEFLNAQEY